MFIIMVFAKSTLTLYNSTAYKKKSLYLFSLYGQFMNFFCSYSHFLKKRRPKISDDKKVNLKNFFHNTIWRGFQKFSQAYLFMPS